MATVDLVVFELDRGLYALDISLVREVIDIRPIMPVPETPDYLLGLVNLRGEVLPVVDTKRRLGLSRKQGAVDPCSGPDEKAKIIIAESADYKAGLLVESLPCVHRADSEKIKAEPTTIKPKIDMEMVSGVLEEDYIVILRLGKLLARPGG